MQTRFRGRIIRVEQGPVTLPNGVRCEFEVVRHPGGSAVVAVDDAHRVCLLRHFRLAVDDWLWELPAGKLDGGEAPQRAARRELAEEAGVEASHWRCLGTVIASPGVFDEKVHLFLATGLTVLPGGARPDADEVYELCWISMDEALAMVLDGRISDAKTAVGLHRASALLAAG